MARLAGFPVHLLVCKLGASWVESETDPQMEGEERGREAGTPDRWVAGGRRRGTSIPA